MNINEGDLVMVRLPNNINLENYYNVWFTVKEVSEETFTGKVSRINKAEYTLLSINDELEISINDIQKNYNEISGQDFCYSDNVTLCSCPGLCRNKM